MADRWAVELAEAILKVNESDGQLVIGKVNSLTPISIKISNEIIDRNIYINPALLLSDEMKIEELFFGKTELPFEFLKQFHKKYVLKQGDIIIAFHFGTSFYILSKVVKS